MPVSAQQLLPHPHDLETHRRHPQDAHKRALLSTTTSLTMRAFVYNANPARVVFGSGTIKQLPDEVKRLGVSMPLVLSTPEQTGHADIVETLLKEASISSAGQFNYATMHTPVEVTEKALKVVEEKNADCVIAIGGGSTIGLGKVSSNLTCKNVTVIKLKFPLGYCTSE